jgi:hypothetical protein
MTRQKLTEFSESTYSQWGEDGIIAKIFDEIGTESRTCIEFGAWDGFHLSNTAKLWTSGWKGVLIEGHKARYRRLVKATERYGCVCINAYVGIDSDNSLEALLARHKVGSSIDLLSIDIDGDDYHVFSSLTTLRPRLVIVEYNPTIPAEMDLYAEPGNYFGCSVTALVRVAIEKGYTLVAITDTNTFFVRNDLAGRLGKYETDLDKIRIDKYVNTIITGYDGRFVLTSEPPYGVSRPSGTRLFGNVHQPKRQHWWKRLWK